jgi:hypothetical protein
MAIALVLLRGVVCGWVSLCSIHPIHRRNIKGVIDPLTAAVARIYGIRSDGAYPIGAFYTVNFAVAKDEGRVVGLITIIMVSPKELYLPRLVRSS